MVVVLPTPLTPTMSVTMGQCRAGFSTSSISTRMPLSASLAWGA